MQENEFIKAYDDLAEAIFRYCFFRVRDRERARELMQDTFTKTWEYIQNGKEVQNIKAFLYRVAHNVCVNEIARSKSFSLDEMQEAIGFDPPDEASVSPERDAEFALLVHKMSQLSASDQELLTMRYLNGLSVSEIADIKEELPNTITVRLKRAMSDLRSSMESL